MSTLSPLSKINDQVPYAQLVGLVLQEDAQGLITCLKADEDNIGNAVIGAIHGGVVAGMLEHAASFHLLSTLKEGARPPKIVDITVDYLRPALNMDTFARGIVIKRGRRVANVQVTAWQDDETKPVATAHAHFLIA